MSKKNNLTYKAYTATRSFIRMLQKDPRREKKQKTEGAKLKIAFIHNEKKISTGAHHINELMTTALATRGTSVRNFYPRRQLADTPTHLRGITNILFFHSLLERKDEILTYDIIQGTTYTPLPFLTFNQTIVSHFGSTTKGFLEYTPKTSTLSKTERDIWHEFKRLNIIPSLEPESFRPFQDIADIEKIVATRVTMCIATSKHVESELLKMGVPSHRVRVIHNTIEDYWFHERKKPDDAPPPHIVFLGRIGGDIFTLKLKGLDRLIRLYRSFPDTPKTTVCMTTNRKLKKWMKAAFPLHHLNINTRKDLIPGALSLLYGSVLFLPSRYEGFSLSLIEGMSQALVPVSYPVGVAPEVIRNGENGYIISSNEEAEERIRELLADDKKRLLMARAARASALQFKSDVIINDLVALYKRLKNKRST